MSMQDSIGNMLTCIRNSQLSKKNVIEIYYSKFKKSILDIFYKEGFIKKIKVIINNNKKKILVYLKYFSNVPVIYEITQISRPSLRIYKSCKNLPVLRSGLGIIIVSTNKGVMTDKQARLLNVGGEIICSVY